MTAETSGYVYILVLTDVTHLQLDSKDICCAWTVNFALIKQAASLKLKEKCEIYYS